MKKLFALILAFASVPFSAYAGEIVINTEEYPPYNYTENDQIKGIATERLEQALKSAGVPYKIQMLSWSKAYNDALNEKNTCVYSTTVTDERKPKFKWVTPLANNNWVFYAKEDSNIQITSLEDAKKYNVGGYRNDALSIFLKENGFKVAEAYEDKTNVKLLQAGRIDLWATGIDQGKILAEKEGLKMKNLFTFKQTELGLACNKDVDDSVVAKLQDALNKIAK